MKSHWSLLLGVWLVAVGPVLGAGPTTQPVKLISRLDGRINECSGVVASRRYPGVFWVHGDSGNPPVLFAIDRQGKLLAQFPVRATNQDWEDIAIDETGHLYIGDIGNNGGKRKQLVVYRVDEPDPASAKAAQGQGATLKVTGTWRLDFPNGPFDCESLFVYKGFGYVISKLFTGLHAVVYRFPLEAEGKTSVLEKVATLPIRSPVTAADISADGKRLAVLTVTGLNLFTIDGDISRAGKVQPVYIS
ncbi:MAG: hypothetical protein ACM359_23740, partial [Bacillota bacterium]